MLNASDKAMPVRVAMVEDDEVIRSNLSHWIAANEAFRLVRSYRDGESALADIPLCKPDVVLMDINLPGIDGVQCVMKLKEKMPQVHFVMLTVYEDSNRLFKALRAGASGYLLKRTPPERLLASILEVHQGGAPMTPEMARRVVQHFQQFSLGPMQTSKLTARELEVLEHLAKGALYKEIEDKLRISTGTLRSYIANIYQKLHVHSRTEATAKYLQGYVSGA